MKERDCSKFCAKHFGTEILDPSRSPSNSISSNKSASTICMLAGLGVVQPTLYPPFYPPMDTLPID